jgi:putative endonuclease
MAWYVYIIECKGSLLYTGITKNLKRRVGEHNRGDGCKFTRCRTPVKLVFNEKVASLSLALKREVAIKRLPRQMKLKLID